MARTNSNVFEINAFSLTVLNHRETHFNCFVSLILPSHAPSWYFCLIWLIFVTRREPNLCRWKARKALTIYRLVSITWSQAVNKSGPESISRYFVCNVDKLSHNSCGLRHNSWVREGEGFWITCSYTAVLMNTIRFVCKKLRR